MTKRSAVKKICRENNGIDKNEQTNPAHTNIRGFLKKIKPISIMINTISWGFIIDLSF